jgi:hypothetical protein
MRRPTLLSIFAGLTLAVLATVAASSLTVVAHAAGTSHRHSRSIRRARVKDPKAHIAQYPHIGNCPVFPTDNPWNHRVDRLPVAAHSAQMIGRIGAGGSVMPDFGSPVYKGEVPLGIPYTVVSNHTRWASASFRWADQSNRGLYPLPAHVHIQGGQQSTGDRHVIIVNRSTCRDYELYNAWPGTGGTHWKADAGAIFDLRSNAVRPAGWTSADAAGLPLLAGLARYQEVARGAIEHALRFTAPCTATRYVYPARHWSHSCGGAWLPPMGLRVRLKSSVRVARFPYQARVIAIALKRYGMILADDGGPWEVSGAPNAHWNDAALLVLERLKGRDFQVVKTGSLSHPAG